MSASFSMNGCEVIKIKSSEIQFPDRYLGEAVLKVILQQMVVAQKDPVYSEDLTMCGLISFVCIGRAAYVVAELLVTSSVENLTALQTVSFGIRFHIAESYGIQN